MSIYSLSEYLIKLQARFIHYCTFTQSLILLAVRYWLFRSFFFSGWLKTKNWQSTEFLFEHEYSVPFLSPHVAAILGTSAEICLPVFILLGLFSRWAAIGLFIFNLIVIASYRYLWTAEGQLGLMDHIMWGIFALVIIAFGPGKISIDKLLNRKCPKYEY